MVDSSGNTPKDYFAEQKNFVKIMKKSFGANWRSAIVTYGQKASVEADFGQFSNFTDFEKAVDKITKDRSGQRVVRLDEAMKTANSDVFSKAREGVTKLSVVLTDGSPASGSNASEVKRVFEASRTADVRVVTLGVGKGVDVEDWSGMVEYHHDLIQLTDSQDLMFKIRDIAATVCAAAGKNILTGGCRSHASQSSSSLSHWSSSFTSHRAS